MSLIIPPPKMNYDEHALFNFIYTDYSDILQYVAEKYIELKFDYEKSQKELTVEQRTLADSNQFDPINHRIFHKFITSITNKKDNKYLTKYKNDNFIKVWLYEFYNLWENNDYLNFSNYINKFKVIIQELQNLQDSYYHAINICFNRSNTRIPKTASIKSRLVYYASNIARINVITHFSSHKPYSKHYVLKNIEEDLSERLFNDNCNDDYKDDDITILRPPPFVNVRRCIPSYNVKKKNIEYTCPNGEIITYDNDIFKSRYNICDEYNPKGKDLVEVLEFTSLVSLCSYYFNQLIENKDTFTVQECELCHHFFIKNSTSQRKYCSNFKNSLDCSKKGRNIMHQIKHESEALDKIYSKINKRLSARSHNDTDKTIYKCFRKLRKLYSDKFFSSSEYKKILELFDVIKSCSGNRELSAEIKKILELYKKYGQSTDDDTEFSSKVIEILNDKG